MNSDQFHNVVERWRGPSNGAVVSTGDSAETLAEFFQVAQTSSGYVVSDQTAMSIATVYRCVGIIGGAISQLPLHHFRLKPDGTREKAPKTPLWWLLNESPIDAWTAAAWKEFIVKSVLLRGDSFAELVRTGSVVTSIRPFHPTSVQVLRKTDGTLLYSVIDIDGERRTIFPEDMLHFAGLGFDGVRSMSVIQWAARQAIGNSLAAADYAGRSFADGTLPQIAIKFPNKFTKSQGDELRDSFASTYNGPRGRKFPLVLAEGADVKELSMTPQDAQLIETRQFEKHDIYTAFGVPPIMGGDNEKTTSWGTGIEQITIGFVRYTLKPHLVRWEEELNRKLFRRAGPFVEFEISGLLRGDAKAQADYYKAALGGPGSGPGWMSVNEIRSLQNLAPIDGADKPFYPDTGTTNAKESTPQPA